MNATLGGAFISVAGQLQKELDNLSTDHGIEISALVSRSGVPIVWHLPDDAQVETFATLSATILGASEVVYSGLGKKTPNKVTIEGQNGGLLIALGLDKKTILGAMSSNSDYAGLSEVIVEAGKRMKGVMSSEHP
jgi:predicted regulator of Ras-like GTPase activity (Roadblock/LC7/MglB family)